VWHLASLWYVIDARTVEDLLHRAPKRSARVIATALEDLHEKCGRIRILR
jgi:hypothetical protein